MTTIIGILSIIAVYYIISVAMFDNILGTASLYKPGTLL